MFALFVLIGWMLPGILFLCASDLMQAQTSTPPNTPLQSSPIVLIHRHTDSLALRSHSGDPAAIHELAQTVFLRVGVPSYIAYSSGYVQRLAQAETDYRNGTLTPIHINDIVRADNDFSRLIGAPAWATTDGLEVTRLRMGMLARYPQLFANPSPTKANGHFAILNPNLSPVEAVFLATSLFYQKEFNAEYQLTSAERAGSAIYPATFYQQRAQILYGLLHGQSASISVSSLGRAAEIFLDDLNISASLRPEFQSLSYISTTGSSAGGRP